MKDSFPGDRGGMGRTSRPLHSFQTSNSIREKISSVKSAKKMNKEVVRVTMDDANTSAHKAQPSPEETQSCAWLLAVSVKAL